MYTNEWGFVSCALTKTNIGFSREREEGERERLEVAEITSLEEEESKANREA